MIGIEGFRDYGIEFGLNPFPPLVPPRYFINVGGKPPAAARDPRPL